MTSHVFDQMRKQGKKNEISLCLKCGNEFWIYWRMDKKPQVKCAPCVLGKKK